MNKKWLAVGIILLFVGTCIIPAIAQHTEKPLPTSRWNWLYVGGSGPGNYTRIQDAIDNASDGDTVFVYNGTYPGSVHINKTISLIGENKETTIIDGNGRDPVVFIDYCISSVTIQGFTITHGSPGIEIWYYANHTTISDNIVTTNVGGICIYGTHNNTIQKNTITSNGAYGICSSYWCADNTIKNNTIQDHDHGIYLDSGFWSNMIIGNNLSNNRDHSIYLFQSDNNIIEMNTIENIAPGICHRNSIRKNNFIGQVPHVTCLTSFMNIWDANYWDDWIGLKWNGPIAQKLPKVLVCYLLPWNTGLSAFPYLNFDWHPAQEPYDIPGAK